MDMDHLDDVTMIINAVIAELREFFKQGKRIIDSNIDIKIAQLEDKEKLKSKNNELNNFYDVPDIKIENVPINLEPHVGLGPCLESISLEDDMKNMTTKFDQSETILEGFKIESEIEKEIIMEKEPTINSYIDDFIAELENSLISNNSDNNTFQSSSVTLDEIDEFLNSLTMNESPKASGNNSQEEWDDVIIFDHDNFVSKVEVDVSIFDSNSYDIVPVDNELIVTVQPGEVESVDVDHTDSEMELTMANTFEVQKLPSNPTKIGEKNSFAVCAEKQVHAALEAVRKQSFKDTGDAIRWVWDPGVNYGDGGEILST